MIDLSVHGCNMTCVAQKLEYIMGKSQRRNIPIMLQWWINLPIRYSFGRFTPHWWNRRWSAQQEIYSEELQRNNMTIGLDQVTAIFFHVSIYLSKNACSIQRGISPKQGTTLCRHLCSYDPQLRLLVATWFRFYF